MKCGRVIKGCRSHYNLEELTVIDKYTVCFSGKIDDFLKNCDIDMTLYRNGLLKREVASKTIMGNEKLFIFLSPEKENE